MRPYTQSAFTRAWLSACFTLAAGLAQAADLFADPAVSLLRTETFAAEAFGGYLTGTAREHVYNVPGDKTKLSQLDWTIDHAFVVGGRATVRPLDWLSIRARGWMSVDGEGKLDDYDWFAGYSGPDSWTHWSTHPDTRLKRAWQGDLSVAASFWRQGGLGLSALAGYRVFTTKWEARGGSYIYSVAGLRDTAGTFPDTLGIAYQQWWQTPYLGLGLSYASDNVAITGEVIGSPWVRARDKDHHVLRNNLFEEDFKSAAMLGASLGAEVQLFSGVWATGRMEYQRYFETRGGTKIFDAATPTYLRLPKPAAGAESETVLFSLGLKAHL